MALYFLYHFNLFSKTYSAVCITTASYSEVFVTPVDLGQGLLMLCVEIIAQFCSDMEQINIGHTQQYDQLIHATVQYKGIVFYSPRNKDNWHLINKVKTE